MLRIAILAGLPDLEEEDEGESPISAWRVKLLEALLWTGALVAWPCNLWPWGKKTWRNWKARRERERALWNVKGKVSTCPPQLTVAFRRRLLFGEARRLRETGQRPEPIAVFGFEADDALTVLEQFLSENPHLLAGEHGDALRWLKYRDKNAEQEGFHRSSWRPIETAAIELMKSGRCKVKCKACDKLFEGSEIRHEPWEAWIPAKGSFHGGGSEGENFRCPNGHLLCENVTGMA